MFMASGPVISWQIEGENVDSVTDFLFLSTKITVDGEDDWFLAGKPWKTWTVCWKADITLLTKIHIVKAMVFPVVT